MLVKKYNKIYNDKLVFKMIQDVKAHSRPSQECDYSCVLFSLQNKLKLTCYLKLPYWPLFTIANATKLKIPPEQIKCIPGHIAKWCCISSGYLRGHWSSFALLLSMSASIKFLSFVTFQKSMLKTCWKCRENDDRPTRNNTTIWMGQRWNLKIKAITILFLNERFGSI